MEKEKKFDFFNNSYCNQRVEMWLIQHDIPYIREKSFKDLRGDKYPLRFDFYLPLQKVAIEADGKQHYSKIQDETDASFNRQRRYDRLKQEYCKQNSIKLERIVYNELDNMDEILNYLLDGEEKQAARQSDIDFFDQIDGHLGF